MRSAARKHEDELSGARSAKDKLIDELEAKLRQCRRNVEELEKLRDELKARIKMAEVVEKKPPVKKKPVDERSKVAAVAVILIGSIIWIASR